MKIIPAILCSTIVLFTSVRSHALEEVLVIGSCPYGAICLTGSDIYAYMNKYYGYNTYQYNFSTTPPAPSQQEILKAEKIRQCKANAGGNFYLCRNDVNKRATEQTLKCANLFLSDNLLAQCNLAVSYEKTEGLDSCEANQKLAEEACNRL